MVDLELNVVAWTEVAPLVKTSEQRKGDLLDDVVLTEELKPVLEDSLVVVQTGVVESTGDVLEGTGGLVVVDTAEVVETGTHVPDTSLDAALL